MLNQTMRVFALLIALTSFIISFAQSDDGTLLSPNMPLPSPLNLLPIGFKPQAAPTPVSAQPAPAPVAATTTPASVAKPVVAPVPTSTPITAPRAVTVPTPTEPTSKPVEVPVGLVMPIVVSTNIPKPIVTTPAAPRVVASVAPKPAPKPVAVKPTPKPAPKPVAAKPAPKPVAVKPAPKPSPVVRASSSRSLMVITAKSTAYNSLAAQTDSSPFVTATGARTRFGVVALSRDLLRRIPYGSIVRIEDLGTWANGRGRGTYNRMLSGVNFIVEDTMNARKRNTVDVWMPSRRAAIQWGARQIRVTVIRFGRR